MVMLCGRSKLRHAWDESRQQRGTTFSYRFPMIKGLFNLTPHLYTTQVILIILLGLSCPIEQAQHRGTRLRHRNSLPNSIPSGNSFSKAATYLTKDIADLEKADSKTNYRQKEKQILDRILDQEVYDSRMRPTGINSTDGATTVNVNLYVRSFEKIDDVKMEYSIQITFRQQWNDNRLAFNDLQGRLKYLTMTDSKKVWMPDTFFRNEKHGQFHNIIQPNLYIRVFPNGDVLYSIRVSLTLSCPMTLELFPLDRQICHLRVASYGWTASDVNYTWKIPDPVQFVKHIQMPGGFELYNHTNKRCDVRTTTGLYSCLSVVMVFKRQLSYYVITIYIPTFLIVAVSWMSFFLDHKSAPARVALTVTTLLAMSTTTSSINNSLPPVAYTKAIDVWSNLCVTFVFLALLEYALVNYAARADARVNAANQAMEREQERQRHSQNMYFEDARNQHQEQQFNQDTQQHHLQNNYRDPLIRRMKGSVVVRNEPNKLLYSELPRDHRGRFQEPRGNGKVGAVHTVYTSLSSRVQSEAKRIDVISRIIFPLSFAGFNVLYWSYYLTKSHVNLNLKDIK